MVNLDRVIAQVLSNGAATGLTSGAGRSLGTRMAMDGAIAAIAQLAHAAFERHRRGRFVSLAGGPSVAFLPPAADPDPRRALGLALLRTMIGAARAGGILHGAAGNSAVAAVQRLALESDEKALLLDELAGSMDVAEIASSPRSPEQAAELYVAALLAIEGDSPAERAWLSPLTARLALPGELVTEIHERLAVATSGDAEERRRGVSRSARVAASG
jgi:uncharacterized membrane protein YebE (DUF533 family)